MRSILGSPTVKQVGKLTATAGVGEEIETAAGVCQIATAAETVPMVEETVGTGEETAAGVCQTECRALISVFFSAGSKNHLRTYFANDLAANDSFSCHPALLKTYGNGFVISP